MENESFLKLILFPLFFLFGISVVSMLGLGYSVPVSEGVVWSPFTHSSGWWDEDGHLVAYGNFSAVNVTENGAVVGLPAIAGLGAFDTNSNASYVYDNRTVGGGTYLMYDNPSGAMSDLGDLAETFDWMGVSGWIVVGCAVLTGAVIASLKFVGSGISDIGVDAIIKGGMYVSVWTILSFGASGLLGSIPWFGAMFWLFLTLVYGLGVVNSVGHPSGGD